MIHFMLFIKKSNELKNLIERIRQSKKGSTFCIRSICTIIYLNFVIVII